jgi:hypothetical protein
MAPQPRSTSAWASEAYRSPAQVRHRQEHRSALLVKGTRIELAQRIPVNRVGSRLRLGPCRVLKTVCPVDESEKTVNVQKLEGDAVSVSGSTPRNVTRPFSVRRHVERKILRFSLSVALVGMSLTACVYLAAAYPDIRRAQRTNDYALSEINCTGYLPLDG